MLFWLFMFKISITDYFIFCASMIGTDISINKKKLTIPDLNQAAMHS